MTESVRTSIGSSSAKLCAVGSGISRTEISAGSGIIAQERARAVRAEERVGAQLDILRRSWSADKDLRERAVLAEVRVDELEEDLDRVRGAR